MNAETVLSCAYARADAFAQFIRPRYSAGLVTEYAVLENNGGQPQRAVWRFRGLTVAELTVIRMYIDPLLFPPGPLRGRLIALAAQLKEHPAAVGRPDFPGVVAQEEGLRVRPGRVPTLKPHP